MSTLDDLWTGSALMVQSSLYKILFTEKLSNGRYLGRLLSDCELGYSLSTEILCVGDQAMWSIM